MNGGRRLKTVLFCLEDEWSEAAEALAEVLKQSQVEVSFLAREESIHFVSTLRQERGSENPGDLRQKCSSGDSGDFQQADGSEISRDFRQLLVMTDCEELARQLKECGIACVGCAGMEYGYFSGAGMVTDSPDTLSVQELEEFLFHCHGWPVTVAVTDRLILREIAEEDIGRLYQISTQECMRYLQDTMEKNFFQRENLLSYIKEVYRLQGYGLWSVWKRDGTLIGCCGLSDTAAEDGQRRLELQYMLDEKFQRRGYGTEMCRAALNYVFARTDQNEVWLRVHPDNHASLRLAKKLGFVRNNCFSVDLKKDVRYTLEWKFAEQWER